MLRRSSIAPRYLEYLKRKRHISGGVFRGMRYQGDAVGSAAAPKILGTYEIELAPVLEQWASVPFASIVDAGAAEGYYAVGCARLWPRAHVTAFEAGAEGRRLLAENAALNGVGDRLTIGGYCGLEELRSSVRGARPALLIMDIEGGEKELLDPEAVPELCDMHFIVEVHDCFVPGLGELLSARFASTHELTEVWTRPRTPEDFARPRNKAFKQWLWPYLLQYADELRPGPMRFLCAVPRRG